MSTEWRTRLFVIGAIVLAITGAVQIADGSTLLTFLLCGIVLVLILNRVQPIPLGALAIGLVMAGYIVGNRGFAQFSLAGKAPLLPAELALIVGLGAVLFKSIAQRELPFYRDPLNAVILLWMVIGTIHVVFDVRVYGFLAIRDYAMVYYAAFFFLAQYLARDDLSRRFLSGCLFVGGIVLLVLQPFYQLYPDFFLQKVAVRGIPLIYYKGDLLATFMATVALLCFLRYEVNKKFVLLVATVVALGFMHASNNRASLVSLLVATGFLVAGRRWRFAALQFGGGALAAVLIVLLAYAKGNTWEETPVFELYERAASITDPTGKGSYRGENTSYKGDNNAFRTVWWETTIQETIETNPWTGLGFGYDLSRRFHERYFPVNDDDFTVRSPHNVLITVFARMGIIGLIPFLAIIALLMRGTFRAVKMPKEQSQPAALWCSALILFTSACFGVVLEGPMGAMVFWTVLGLAHHELTANKETAEAKQVEPTATASTANLTLPA